MRLPGKDGFTRQMIISTTEKWVPHAEEALEDQQIPVTRVGLADIAASPIDWRVPAPGDVTVEVELDLHAKKQSRPHQADAIQAVFTGFARPLADSGPRAPS